MESTDKPCPQCHNRRIYPIGILPDGRPRLVVCHTCGGQGPVAEPAPLLRHELLQRVIKTPRRSSTMTLAEVEGTNMLDTLDGEPAFV